MRRRRTVLAFALLGFGIAVTVALLRTPKFVATFAFMPQSSQDQSRSGLASLAGQFGIPVGAITGGSEPPQLYADLLVGREVLGALASDTVQVSFGGGRRGPIADFLEIKEKDPAIRRERTFQALRSRVVSTSVAARNSTGVINAMVRTESPQVSLEIARRLIDGLNQFNRLTRQSQAREERLFAERSLQQARAGLRAAEDALQGFLQRNKQFESPDLKFQHDRLEREVALQQQVVTGLAQQYEDARIREVRDTPVITLIERPELPALPEPRRRATIVVLGTGVAFGIGIFVVLVREGWQRQNIVNNGDESHRSLAEEWRARDSFPAS